MSFLLSRYTLFRIILLLAMTFALLGAAVNRTFYWPLVVFLPLALLGLHDVTQRRHSILRNYPVIGHIRFLLEAIRPEIRQ